MARKRLRVSKLDGRRFRYPYPVYYRPPLRWITPSFTTKNVTLVAREFGPEILHAIHHNDLEFLQRILENRLRADSLIKKLCMMDVGRGAASRRVSCPLIIASQKKDPTILRYMLEKGADPNYVEYTSRRPHGYCALHTTAKLGLLETTETLLLFKANPNAVDSRGETPLLIAVHADNCALAKLLLSHGANPNARDKYGCTPLHIATSHGHLEMVNVLLSHGADVKLPNRSSAFPVNIAASAGHVHLVEALVGADTESANATCLLDGIRQMPLHLAAGKGHVEVVTALLDLRADVNAKDSAGNTALHHVVLKPYQANTMRNTNHFFATAQALIKANIRVNDENNHGETALVLAASNQFPKVAKLILSSAGKDLRIRPELLQQILLEQNILTAENQNEELLGQRTDTLPNQMQPSVGNPKSIPAGTEQKIKTFAEESKPDSHASKESHPLKEIQSTAANSQQTNSSAQTPDVFAKRYPLPKSDLRNYHQFRHSPTIENEISTFTVTAKKGAERMLILFDKNSPSGKKATSADKGSENESRRYIQKKPTSTSSDVTKPATKRLKSTDDNTRGDIVPQTENRVERRVSSSEQTQNTDGKNDQKQDSSKISQPRTFDLGSRDDELVKKRSQHPVKDNNSDEDEESCWIDHKVEKDDLLTPFAYRDKAPSYRHYSKSPSGFRSEGGGLRGLRLRVTGEVPKAYTCKQKAAKRKAFFLATPVGIESVGDHDRTHLSMSSLPEMGGLAWEKAMQRRIEWTEAPKPVFAKGQNTPPSREFSPTLSAGKRTPKSDYRITGLFPQPYKSFGKIETKTDAIEAALMDYESDEDEEYESDSDVEPLTTQWVSEMTERQWHRNPSDEDEHFDTSLDDVVNANVLDESICSIEAEQIAGIISNGDLSGITEEDRNLGEPSTGTDEELDEEETEEEDDEEESDEEESDEQQEDEMKGKGAAEQRTETVVRGQITPGRSGAGVLRVLHGYPSKGKPSSNSSSMVVSSVEPGIQMLTIENIVIADSGTSDDQEDDEISDLTKPALPMQIANSDRTESEKGDTGEQQKKKHEVAPVLEPALEHQGKEIKEMLRLAKVRPDVSTQDKSWRTDDKENKNETGEVLNERREDLMSKQSKVSPGVDDEVAVETQKPNSKEKLMDAENLEETKKKRRKEKETSKKHTEKYENVVVEEISEETVISELPAKGKKKSRSKVTKKESFVDEPELKPQIDENVVTKDTTESHIHSVQHDVDDINNVYAEEPIRRQRKAEKNLRTESDDHALQKEIRGKEEELIHAYSEEPERRGKQRKGHIKESEERKDKSQEHIAENIDSEQPHAEKERTINVRTKRHSEGEEAKINDEDYSHQVYDEEPGSRRRPSKREKANEMAKDVKPDHMEGQGNEEETLAQDEFTQDTVKSKNKKQKQKKGKDVAEQSQNEDTGKSEANDELQKPSQDEEVAPIESELIEIQREGMETFVVEDSEKTDKPNKKKKKKKVKGRVDSITEQHGDHSTTAENLSDQQNNLSNATNEVAEKDSTSTSMNKQDGTSFETASESIGEGSSFADRAKKGKKPKKKDVSMNNNWGINSAVHSEVWQEAMNEQPLASSETVYDAMHLSDAEKAKAKKTAKKKLKNAEAETILVEDLSGSNIMVKGKPNSAENDNDLIAQTSPQQQIYSPFRPLKETDIDDEFGEEEYYPKTSHTPDSLGSHSADRRTRVTMETSVDDIMDELEENKVRMETSVDDIMDELQESKDGTTSNYVKPIGVELVKQRHKSRETSIDDELDDLPAYPKAAADDAEESDTDVKVEKSLETNVDEYSEEPFKRRSSHRSNKESTEKPQPLKRRESVESKASKVTNVDEYHVVPDPFGGVEIKLKQPDSRIEHMADTEGTSIPEVSEQLEAVESKKPKHGKKGSKKKTKPVVQQTTEDEDYKAQREMEEIQNAEEDRVVHSKEEEEADIKRDETKKQGKVADEELNDVTYPEAGDAENVQNVKRKKKKRKQISDKALIEGVEENLENVSEQADMQKKKAPESAYEDNNEDEEGNNYDEETEINLDNDVRIYPQKREYILDSFVREPRIDEDEENQDDEETSEMKESDHEEAIMVEDLDEDSHSEDDDQQKIQRPIIKLKRFGEDSSLSEDGDDIVQENSLRTFNIETASKKKMQEKPVTKKEKPEKEIGSDEDLGEMKRRKKTRKPVGEAASVETGFEEDMDNSNRPGKGQTVKERKSSEGDKSKDHARIHPQKQDKVRGKAVTETGIDDDIESQDDEVQESDMDEDLDDESSHKIKRDKIKIKRFGEDSSLSEENDEIIPENALKTFNIGTQNQKKIGEKPVTKTERPEKEMGSDEDLGEIRRRKKTRKPVGEAAHKETSFEEDMNNSNRQKNGKKVKANERNYKATEDDVNVDDVRIYAPKREPARGKAARETGIDDDIDSHDDEEIAEVEESGRKKKTGIDGQYKIEREKIRIKRFGEDSSLSEENDEIIPENTLKTFNIGTDSQKKKNEKPVTKKEKSEKEIGSDEDLGEMKRRKKTRKPVGEAAHKETSFEEDMDNSNRPGKGQTVKERKATEGDKSKDHARIHPQKQDQVRGKAVTETGMDDHIESQDDEVQDSDMDEDLDDESLHKIKRDKIAIKRFGEDSSLSEDNEEIKPENALKTFNIGTQSQKKIGEKSVTKQERPEKEIGSDEDLGEIKRRKKTRKPVGEAEYKETGFDEDMDNSNRQKNGKKVKANERNYKATEGEVNVDDVRIFPQKQEHVRRPASRETGIDDDIESEDDEEMAEVEERAGLDEGQHKIKREKIKIKRFGEDSSLSEENDEIIPENALKTFNIGTQNQKKKNEKPVTKKEKPEKDIGSDEDLGEMKRRKKTRKPVEEPEYKETSFDEDMDNSNRQKSGEKVKTNERNYKATEEDVNVDHARIHPQKQEHVRGKAVRETGIDDDIESQDDEVQESDMDEDLDDEIQLKIKRDKIKIKRFGEHSSLSEDNEEIIPENALKTFNIGTQNQKKKNEKSVTKQERPEKEIGSDEDLGEIKRRKKTRKPVGEAVYTETGIEEDLDNSNRQEKQSIAKGRGKKESSIDEDLEDDNDRKPTKQTINIRRFKEDSSLSEDDDIEQDPKHTAKTFEIGTDKKTKMEGKWIKKTSKPTTPDAAMDNDEDYGELRRRQKTRTHIPKTAYEETGIDDDLDESTNKEDEKEYSKVHASKANKLRKSGVDPSANKKSSDNLPKGDTKKTELKSKERNALKFSKAGNEITSEEEEDEWTEEDSEEEEEVEESMVKTKRRASKEGVSKLEPEGRLHSKQRGKTQVNVAETSNKEIESDDEEADDFEYRRRTKAARVSPGRPTDKRNSSTVIQNDKVLSETNFDQLSESDDSDDEHQMRVTAKVEAMLSKKKRFNEQEFDVNEENKVETRKISSFMGTDDDDDPHYRKFIQMEHRESTPAVSFTKKQQPPHPPTNTFEMDESEEIGSSFSRKQAGRVSRGRMKKGTGRIQDPTLQPSSNADTEGSSRGDPSEDNRRRSAGIQRPRNWNTEETEITETEIITSDAYNVRKSTPSAVTTNDSIKKEEAKRRSLQQTQLSSPSSQGLDLDESIRRKRRMEMTEDITVTTTTTTSPNQDNSLSPSGTENSSNSWPSPPNRQPPKKRDIKPLNSSAPLQHETTFDVEPPPATRPTLDFSLLEVTPSKKDSEVTPTSRTDPSKRRSLEASILRKSVEMERTFQRRTQRQHSAESLNRQRPRSQVNEFDVKKSSSDAHLSSRRKRSSVRSRSTGNLDLRPHYNGLYKTQREQKTRPVNFKQPDKTLQEAALETITSSALNEPRWLRRMDDLENIVYTRGVYRPQPVYWRGSHRTGNANDESHISGLHAPENHGLNESTEDANKTGESLLDKSKLNGNGELNTSAPPKLSLSKEGDDSENRNSAFAAYNKRVTIHEDVRHPQQFYGRRGHSSSRRRRTMRPSRDQPDKAPQITEPNAVDFSKYGIIAQLWMEQVDMKTVLKSKTMYLSIMPLGAQPPEEIMRSMRHAPTVEDQSAPAQWIIARGRTIRRQKRHMDGQRMSESFFLSGGDSDPDLSRSANPMSPGKQSLLFFKVGGRWPDLAWALFEGIHTDAATLRMIKDIQLKNPGRLTDQIQDMMNRWWTQKGQSATIEELRRSLELINLPFVQDETLNVTMANSFFSTSDLENKLAFEEVGAADPEVSRMIHEYNLHSHNASFNAEHRQSPQTAQPFTSDALLRQMQQKGLMTKSSPTLRNSQLKPGDNRNSSMGRSDSRDASFIRHQSRNESLRMFSSQDSLNTENVGDDSKRKSFMIVQPQLKKAKDKKFRHESNM